MRPLRLAHPGSATSSRLSLRTAREALAATSLAGIVGGCFLLSAGAASGSSLFVHASHDTQAADFDYPGWLAGPLRGLAAPLSVTGWIELVVALFGLYVLVLLVADVVRPAWAVAALLASHLLLFLSPPLWLTDVYNYIGFARLGVTHGLDPYSHTLSAIPGDPAVSFATWLHISSPYGPLFTLLSYPLAVLGVAAGTWVVKATIVAAGAGQPGADLAAGRGARPPYPSPPCSSWGSTRCGWCSRSVGAHTMRSACCSCWAARCSCSAVARRSAGRRSPQPRRSRSAPVSPCPLSGSPLAGGGGRRWAPSPRSRSWWSPASWRSAPTSAEPWAPSPDRRRPPLGAAFPG